jgi:CheY-like chemotaxis protein
MLSPPIPADDHERVAVLRSLGVLDTPPEPVYDELTQLAAQVCGVPMALITLIDADRQWVKSKSGIGRLETKREFAFCAHAISEPEREVFVVPDTQRDARFADHPSVTGDPSIRFYAGAPLVTDDGWALGTLCVFDRVPRELTPEQVKALSTLRRHVVNTLELRRLVAQQNRLVAELESTRRELDLARRTPAASPEAFDAQFAARHPARVLIAEDNRVNQKVLVRMLARLGYRPVLAQDGRAAVTAVARERFDLVLMDIEMPELDGPSATREIRARGPAGHQPVIVAATAHAIASHRESYLAAGMDEYLTKPVRLEDLTTLFARLPELRRHRAA